ncbi:MAG: bifunctional methylenetetrahydrofolate dehydrogenase/methenyltetrahydrofolate cyclohydrolase, partial [Bauldia sp.]|nr:bifunctional methylenetetrahydrofolate dehydrogenase/methenyltetrahydrofolate cyclohydrolase [Bauldia sp.]
MAKGQSSSASGNAAIIDGRAVAARVTERVAEETRRLRAEAGVVPGLAVVLVGDDPASHVYVGAKGRKADELGFHSVQHTMAATTSEEELLALVEALNGNPEIHGILIQLPLPSHIDTDRVIEAIRPEK